MTAVGMRRSAVVLLSGGLDSATTLAIAARRYRCHALSFDYGQRHRHELEAASAVAQKLGVAEHKVLRVDPRAFRGSALTSDDIDVPLDRNESTMATNIPSTYVPARNTIFLSYALGFAETTRSSDIFIGANAVDYSGYPDCRPEYFRAFQRLARLATKQAVERGGHEPAMRIHTPLLHWSKRQIIAKGMQLGVDFAYTHSCYNPARSGKPCGRCDSCRIRGAAFRELGFDEDPAMARFADAGNNA